MANDLLNLQREFLAHLYDVKNLKIAKSLSYSNPEAVARLNVYRNNVFGNFSSVLSSVFCVSKKILGDKKFDDLVEKYIKTYASKSGNLDEYGEFFVDFLQKKFDLHKISFLPDLATVELAHYKTFFLQKTKSEFDLKKFKKIPPEKFPELTFSLHPSCILFSSKFAIFSIWQKEQKTKNNKAEFLLVANTIKPILEQLSEAEFLFLIEIGEGKKLYQAYKKACQKNKNFDVGKTLDRFIKNHVINNFFHE